jgi:hypothetical protein
LTPKTFLILILMTCVVPKKRIIITYLMVNKIFKSNNQPILIRFLLLTCQRRYPDQCSGGYCIFFITSQVGSYLFNFVFLDHTGHQYKKFENLSMLLINFTIKIIPLIIHILGYILVNIQRLFMRVNSQILTLKPPVILHS